MTANVTSPTSIRRAITMNADDLRQFNVKTYEDVIARMIEMRETRDEMSFAMGDLVLLVCVRKIGRPADEDNNKTIGALADEIGEDRPVLSALAANAEFYNPKLRLKIPPQISWRQCAKARKASGWRPGEPVTVEHRRRAMSMLFRTADNAPRSVKHERTLVDEIDNALAALDKVLLHKSVVNVPDLEVVAWTKQSKEKANRARVAALILQSGTPDRD